MAGLDANSEGVVLHATAQLSMLLRVSGGPLKGAQPLRASLEALVSIRRLSVARQLSAGGVAEENRAGGGQSPRGKGSSPVVMHLDAWHAVAQALTGLSKELAIMPGAVSLGGDKEIQRDAIKDLFRRALKLKPKEDEAAVRDLLEILSSLDALLP